MEIELMGEVKTTKTSSLIHPAQELTTAENISSAVKSEGSDHRSILEI